MSGALRLSPAARRCEAMRLAIAAGISMGEARLRLVGRHAAEVRRRREDRHPPSAPCEAPQPHFWWMRDDL